MSHSDWCPTKALAHSDAAKRLSDTFNLHRVAAQYDSINKWFAVRLHDGTSDGVLYDSKSDCIRHQGHNEQFYAFIKIIPCMMTPCEAEVLLNVHRRAYDAGFRLTDPDHPKGGRQLIQRVTVEDQLALAKGQVRNVILPGEE